LMLTCRLFRDWKRPFRNPIACSERMRTIETWLLNSSLRGRSRSGFLYGATTQFSIYLFLHGYTELDKVHGPTGYAESAQINSPSSISVSRSFTMRVSSQAVESCVLPVKP
jgi:hypothetical protein